MATALMSTRGRITIPKNVRAALKLRPGSKIDFVVEPGGRVIFQPLRSDFKIPKGMLKSKLRRRTTVEEMNEAIARGYSGT